MRYLKEWRLGHNGKKHLYAVDSIILNTQRLKKRRKWEWVSQDSECQRELLQKVLLNRGQAQLDFKRDLDLIAELARSFAFS